MDNIDIEIEKKYAKKWNWIPKSDDELKNIAKDLYNNLIFTDKQCSQHELSIVFIPLIFLNPSSKPSSLDKADIRNKIIYDLLEKEIEYKHFNNYISEIGMIYEYYSEAGPTGINGKPTFYSMRMLCIHDYNKMVDFYLKYKEIRELADNF